MHVSAPPESWLAAVEGLVPIPAEDRQRAVGEAEAADILRCGPDLLESLVRQGLPVVATDAGGRPLFDYHDVINVGLHSGSGASLGEMGERVLMRFAAEDPASWTEPRRWAVHVEHRCLATRCAAGEWETARPAPEVSGGRCEAWQPTQPAGQDGDGHSGGAVLTLEATIEARGLRLTVQAEPVQILYQEWLADVLSQRLRFQWLPGSLRLDPERVHRMGLTDCVSASLMLERQLSALGLESRTRKGHVVGLMSVEHAWAEFRDVDGRWKFLDPILALVAHRAGQPHPEFDEFCLGSIASRVIPWDCEAAEELAVHHCGSSPGVATNVVGASAR